MGHHRCRQKRVWRLQRPVAILIPLVKDKATGKRVVDFMVQWTTKIPDGAWSGASGFNQWTTRTSIPEGKTYL
jgi:hypothetical protein